MDALSSSTLSNTRLKMRLPVSSADSQFLVDPAAYLCFYWHRRHEPRT